MIPIEFEGDEGFVFCPLLLPSWWTVSTESELQRAQVENTGVEPVTSCMPCKRSSQLS